MAPTIGKRKSFSNFFRRDSGLASPTIRSPPTSPRLAPPPTLRIEPPSEPETSLSTQSPSPDAPSVSAVSTDLPQVADEPAEELLDQTRHAPDASTRLDASLALLDSRFASLESHERDSVALSSALPLTAIATELPDSSDEEEETDNNDDEDDRSVEVGRGPVARAPSLSEFQLPSGDWAGGESEGGDFFGRNTLWDALGLEAEDDSSEGESMVHELTASMAPHLTSTPPKAQPPVIRRVSSGSASSVSSAEEISDDIFNLSEFPAFGDLPSFSSDQSSPNTSRDGMSQPPSADPAAGWTVSSASVANRASKLLSFPIPPPASPPKNPLPAPPRSRAESVSSLPDPAMAGRRDSSDGIGLGLTTGAGLGMSGLHSSNLSLPRAQTPGSASIAGTDEGPFALDIPELPSFSSSPDPSNVECASETSPKQSFEFDFTGLDFDYPEEGAQSPHAIAHQLEFGRPTELDYRGPPSLAIETAVARILRKQASLPAMLSAPRAVAMENRSPVDSPLTFEDDIADTRCSSRASRTEDSSHSRPTSRSYSRPASRSNSRASSLPRSPIEFYGASLANLKLGDEYDYPMWADLPASPSVASSKARSKVKARSPSPAPKSMSPRLATVALPAENRISRSFSFVSMKRRKSESALATISAAEKALEKSKVKSHEDDSLSPDKIAKEVKKRNRLSAYIPRFNSSTNLRKDNADYVPPTPTIPKAHAVARPVEKTYAPKISSETTDSQGGETPSLDPPSSAFTATSTFITTPATSVGDTCDGYFALSPSSKSDYASPSEEEIIEPLRSPSSTDRHKSITLSQFIPRPTRTSSIFPMVGVDYTKKPLGSPSLDPKKELSFADVQEANDVIVFPVVLPSTVGRSVTPSAPSIQSSSIKSSSQSHEFGSDEEDDDDEQQDTDEDDVPLGTKPGALTAQKSLRISASHARTKRRAAKRSDPFEFDGTSGSASAVSSSQAVGSGSVPPPITVVSPASTSSHASHPSSSFHGHSLLPHSDHAISRSPSLPLDPSIAESTLTIDQTFAAAAITPDRPVPPPAPRRAETAPLIGSFRRAPPAESKRVRPALTVKTSYKPDATPALQSPRSPPLLTRAPTGRRSPQAQIPSVPTAPAVTVAEQKIFVVDHQKHFLVPLRPTTRAGDIIQLAKEQDLLKVGRDTEGGFALFEICRSLGVERPMREYELVTDVMKTWDHESNLLVLRRTLLWPVLSNHLRPQPIASRGDWVQLHDNKKCKWSKRFLELRDGAIHYGKTEKAKDSMVLCQLANFEVYFVAPHQAQQLKAPKVHSFCLKSILPRAHFEDVTDFAFFVSLKTGEEMNTWIKAITEARNSIVRTREQAVLTANGIPTVTSPTTAASNQSLFAPTAPARTKSIRKPPPHLAAALAAPPMLPSRSAPSSIPAVLESRPSPAVWASMSEADRQTWLAETQKEAKNTGRSFFSFANGAAAPPMARSKSAAVRK